jgi:hypothetical protein
MIVGPPGPARLRAPRLAGGLRGADAWEADVRRLIEVSKQLIGRAASATDETLLAPLPQRGGRSLAFALLDLAAHDAYHAGQVRQLRALQGV